MRKREPAVEGRFYPSTKADILSQIKEIDTLSRYESKTLDIKKIIGAVLPHAGHLYSGHQTVPFFKLLNLQGIRPETFVIIHPNHSGMGAPLAIDDSDVWTNSIGDVSINRSFAQAMGLPFDQLAHSREHSAEVIVPFLQYYLEDHPFSIVSLCMRDQSFDRAKQVSESIKKAVRISGQNIIILASCDFSHFVPPGEGRSRDQLAVDEIMNKNSHGVERVVRKYNLSICGYGPIMALMEYSKSLDPLYKIDILARGHSGEVSPSSEVVDYISMVLYQ